MELTTGDSNAEFPSVLDRQMLIGTHGFVNGSRILRVANVAFLPEISGRQRAGVGVL